MDNAIMAENKGRLDSFRILSGAALHAAADTPIATASAVDVASLIILANSLATSFGLHVPNSVDAITGVGLHGVDSGHRIGAPAATDFASARSLLSEVENTLQAHAASTPAHFTPSHLSAPYFEQSGSVLEVCAHANALQVQCNAHYAAALNAGVAS